MPTVQMIQTSKHKWRLLGPKGNILIEDLNISCAYDAEQYVKSYISSFMSWTYEIIPINKEK